MDQVLPRILYILALPRALRLVSRYLPTCETENLTLVVPVVTLQLKATLMHNRNMDLYLPSLNYHLSFFYL